MSVKIRLTRIGRHSEAIYRIVVADSRFARDGRYVEQIGFYNPAKPEEEADINEELALKWLAKGALPSDSIRTLFTKKGIMEKHAATKSKPAPKKAKPAKAATKSTSTAKSTAAKKATTTTAKKTTSTAAKKTTTTKKESK